MTRSRISQKIQRKSKAQLYFSILGIIVVLFLLIKFGIPLLINFSLFIEGSSSTTNQSQNNQKNSSSIVLAPTLYQTFSATNSAEISVSGIAAPKENIQLFVNDALSQTVQTKDDGSFSFSKVILISGQNSLKARADKDNKQSEFSNIINVSYSNSKPNLTISSPSDGQSFSGGNSQITVNGATDPDDRVTVNGFWAIVDNKGNYSYTLKLQNGGNQIKVVSTDSSGNTTEKDINVNYSQ